MYISENYLAFYSYLMGFELKILIELKDIKDIIKEPIRKLFRHSMRVVTKENQEVNMDLRNIRQYTQLDHLTQIVLVCQYVQTR